MYWTKKKSAIFVVQSLWNDYQQFYQSLKIFFCFSFLRQHWPFHRLVLLLVYLALIKPSNRVGLYVWYPINVFFLDCTSLMGSPHSTHPPTRLIPINSPKSQPKLAESSLPKILSSVYSLSRTFSLGIMYLRKKITWLFSNKPPWSLKLAMDGSVAESLEIWKDLQQNPDKGLCWKDFSLINCTSIKMRRLMGGSVTPPGGAAAYPLKAGTANSVIGERFSPSAGSAGGRV